MDIKYWPIPKPPYIWLYGLCSFPSFYQHNESGYIHVSLLMVHPTLPSPPGPPSSGYAALTSKTHQSSYKMERIFSNIGFEWFIWQNCDCQHKFHIHTLSAAAVLFVIVQDLTARDFCVLCFFFNLIMAIFNILTKNILYKPAKFAYRPSITRATGVLILFYLK